MKIGQMTGGRMDGHTDNQSETIIPRHYQVVGYKNQEITDYQREIPLKESIP